VTTAAPAGARILLVRHGQIEANVAQRWHGSTDEDLTAHGRAQAHRVAAHLARERPSAVALYASPARRARSTAAPIAAALTLPVVVEPDVTEYGIGVLENEPYVDLTVRHRFFEQASADLAWAPPGGESLGAVAARVTAAWRRIAAAHPASDVIVVSHGAAIAIGLALLLHDDPRQWSRYHSRNTAITEILLAPPTLVTFDRVDHLD